MAVQGHLVLVLAHVAVDDAAADLEGQVTTLQQELRLLEGTTSTYADQLAREEALKQSLADATDAYFQALRKGWSEGLKQVFHQLPDADWCA